MNVLLLDTRSSMWWRPRSAWPPAATVVDCQPARLTPLHGIALQALALWPHGAWAARRVADGSDDPLGLLALGVVAALLVQARGTLRLAPSLPWLVAAVALTVGANAALFVAPPLAAALVAVAALAAGIAAWWPKERPLAPMAMLLVLSLPLIASLQYYAGWPLRWITAEASALLLQLAGWSAQASGAAMTVAGRLVIVDAPCSGVQMAWMAWFSAATVAAVRGLPERRFLTRLPLVGALVLAGNIVRNSVLVALEARPQGLDATLHEAVGLVALAAVCAASIGVMSRRAAP